MKYIIELLIKNPIFKIAGIALVLYFGLYANKEDPNSLGRRLSKENIKKDISAVKDKSFFIVDKLRESKEVAVKGAVKKEGDEEKKEIQEESRDLKNNK